MSVRPSVTKCLSNRTLRLISRRSGYNNKLSPDARAQLRHVVEGYLTELVEDAVTFSTCSRKTKMLRLPHVVLALERRGITICGAEPVRVTHHPKVTSSSSSKKE